MSSRLLIALDYELFFGRKVGSVEHCLIRPIEALKRVVDPHGVKLCLFVDAGYIDRLKRFMDDFPELAADYERIGEQLRRLKAEGHDVQLHIHPHWEDTDYQADGGWRIDTRRYRLHDFSREEMDELVGRYKAALVELVGDEIFAYRAGGWCMQPFEVLGDVLFDHGIWLDSTVYDEGFSPDTVRGFDFRGAPRRSIWRFDRDPLVESETGRFLEIPITACRVWPTFFWKMAFLKKFARGDFKPFGDGSAMVANAAYYRKLLTQVTNSVASIDGAKAGLLERAYRGLLASGREPILNLIGHPKALTPYSLKRLDRFLGRHPELEPVTFQAFRHLQHPGGE